MGGMWFKFLSRLKRTKAFSVKHYYLLPVVLGSCSYALFIKQMYGDGRGLAEQDCILP